MEIKINIDDYIIEKILNKHCDNSVCVDCKCEVLPDEEYVGYYDKYKKLYCKSDIETRINKTLENI